MPRTRLGTYGRFWMRHVGYVPGPFGEGQPRVQRGVDTRFVPLTTDLKVRHPMVS